MAQKTIQCRLVATADTRRQLWTLMAEQNTPLVNELIQQVIHNPDFDNWRQQGKHPATTVSDLCKTLKTEPPFSGQPARFYASAIKTTNYIFKSWLKLQKGLHNRLTGKRRWLDIFKSDEDLAELSGKDLQSLSNQASRLLKQLENNFDGDKSDQKKALRRQLFQKYDTAKAPLTKAATAYLLKHNCKLPEQPEDLDKFAQRRHKAELQVKQLEAQLDSRFPKGRDLTGEAWLNTLLTATQTVPQDNQQHKRWQDQLLAKPKTVPYPIIFETNEDLVWSLNGKGRLCVHFNGLRDLNFQVYCDQRQLPWFRRFLADQNTKRASKNQHSSSLFTLRSARLTWSEQSGKGRPWDVNHLTLYCSVDTRLWSQEGTDSVRQERAVEVAQKLTHMQEKDALSDNQIGFVKRLNSTLARLHSPYPRPSQKLYQGKPYIIVGLSFGRNQPVTLAVWNALTDDVLTYRSVKQLLGKNYPLLNRQRQQQRHSAHQRHKFQKRSAPKQPGMSDLGQHIDRLLAKAIIQTAQQYQAGSIALPNTDRLRDLLNAEIQARAEQKIPGYVAAQKQYAKQYRTAIHQWSYGRLAESIASKASQMGIAIEVIPQNWDSSPQAMAKAVATSAYTARLSAIESEV